MATMARGLNDDALPAGARLRLGTTALRHEVTVGNEGVSALAFSPDGKVLAAAGREDGRISLWDVSTGRMIRVLAQKSYRILALAISPDGKYLAAGDDEATIHLWDYKTGKLLRKLTGNWVTVEAVAFSPDGKHLASAHFGNSVCLFDPASGKLLHEWHGEKGKTPLDGGECFSALAFSSDGQMLAAGSGRQILREVTPAQLKKIKQQFWKDYGDLGIDKKLLKTVHDDLGRNISLGDNKSYVGENWERVWIWELATGKVLHKLDTRDEMAPNLKGAATGVGGLGFVDGSKRIVACGWTGNLRAWQLSKDKEPDQPKLAQKVPTFTRIVFSPDRKLVALTGSDITLLDSATFKTARTVKQPFCSQSIFASAFSPDGSVLATAQQRGSINLWDVRNGRELSPGSRHYDGVNPVAFTADGKHVVTVSGGNALLWDKAGKEMGRLQDLPYRLDSHALSPDGRRIAVSGMIHKSKDSFYEGSVWDWDKGKVLWKRKGVTAVAFLNKDSVILGLEKGTVEIADSSTGKTMRQRQGPKLPVKALAASPDGTRLVADCGEGFLHVWHLAKQGPAERIVVPKAIPFPGARVSFGLLFSPDSKQLAWYAEDGTTVVFDVATWREIVRFQPKQLARRETRTFTVAFTAQGRVLAAGAASLSPERDGAPEPKDYTAWVWDPLTGKDLWTSAANERPIASIALSTDGQTLATGSWDTTVLLWDLTKSVRSAR